MGLFSSKPSKQEINAFARKKQGSAKAAAAYAQQKRDQAATRQAMAERRAAWKKGKR